MSESHQDKGRVSFISPKTDTPDELTALLNKTKADKDAEASVKAEKSKAEMISKQKELLKKKFEDFMNDDTSLQKVVEHDMEWAVDGFLVEIFVADFSTESKLIITGDDLFLKYTPYAKILAASPLNQGIRKEWKVGDVIHLGDSMAQVKINPAWEMHTAAGKASGRVMEEAPIKYIRHIHDFINRGYYYALDKAEFILDREQCVLTEETMKRFKGPFTFCLESFLAPRRVKGNPWA